MLEQPTLDKLKSLRLHGFAQAWTEQSKSKKIREMDFDDRVGLLVDAEMLARENRRLTRNLQAAKLKLSNACIEDIDYKPERKLDKPIVRQLATCEWIKDSQNIVITGCTGVGKTYLACALAQQACRRGYKALYRRFSRLFDELTLARAEGSYVRLLERWAKIDVLLIDDWGLVPLKAAERRDLNEILEDRYGTRSTIITSQMPTSKWHDYIGDPTTADAICDRILNNAHRLKLSGPTRRKDPKLAI